jgi:putative transposase
VRRAYKFRVYPTSGQAARAAWCLRDHQRLYNAALEERREAWQRGQVSIRYGQQSAQLKEIRRFDPDQGRWSFSSQQATLRRLDKATAAFYRRCQAGGAPGYPRFKAVDRWDSVEWPKDGDGCRWKPEAGRVYLQGVGHVKVRAHRRAGGRVKTISLKREGRRSYVVLSCDDVPARPLASTGRQVGVDVGVARFATTSDGEVIPNPKFARESAATLAAAQHVLARKLAAQLPWWLGGPGLGLCVHAKRTQAQTARSRRCGSAGGASRAAMTADRMLSPTACATGGGKALPIWR